MKFLAGNGVVGIPRAGYLDFLNICDALLTRVSRQDPEDGTDSGLPNTHRCSSRVTIIIRLSVLSLSPTGDISSSELTPSP